MPERGSEKNDGTAVLLGELQAALWLSESLILALLEANLLDTTRFWKRSTSSSPLKKPKPARIPNRFARR
jgi:hypothetical protein